MKFKFALYQRPFQQPLRTSHGLWQIREGIIVSLDSQGKIARGEIAPIPWFGSETIAQALEFCQSLAEQITPADIAKIPERLPACQFGLGSALLALTATDNLIKSELDSCYLLPAGDRALTAWEKIYRQHQNRTFKWKIGVETIATEIDILQQLVAVLPDQTQLRLDANGGLSYVQAQQLLTVTDQLPQIEFVEQPLSPQSLPEMIELSQKYQTLLALDESVASFRKLRSIHQQGWQGVYVIKAGIMGFPQPLLEYCQRHALDVVFSSVLETDVGRNCALQLAQQLNHPRAVGFGIDGLFQN